MIGEDAPRSSLALAHCVALHWLMELAAAGLLLKDDYDRYFNAATETTLLSVLLLYCPRMAGHDEQFGPFGTWKSASAQLRDSLVEYPETGCSLCASRPCPRPWRPRSQTQAWRDLAIPWRSEWLLRVYATVIDVDIGQFGITQRAPRTIRLRLLHPWAFDEFFSRVGRKCECELNCMVEVFFKEPWRFR